MIAGAGRRHDAIVVNLTAAIHSQIRGGPCQTFTGDTYIATSPSTRRMPDLGVDCGKPDDASLTADRPALVVEVLSPTTGGFDVTVKLAEYHALRSLDYILFVDTESPNVHLYSHQPGGNWSDVLLKGLEAILELESLGITLELGEIYAGLDFRPRPKLVEWRHRRPATKMRTASRSSRVSTGPAYRVRASASQTPPPIMKPPEMRETSRVRWAENSFRARPASSA